MKTITESPNFTIKIDPMNYSIHWYDLDGNEIPAKDKLEFPIDVPVNLGVAGTVTYKLYYVTKVKQLKEAVKWGKKQRIMGLDLETGGLSPYKDKIATIQIGWPLGSEPTAFVIDVRCFTPEQLAELFALLENPDIIKLGQNIKFECLFLNSQYGVKLRNLQDTQVSEMIIRAGLLPLSKGGGDGESDRAAYGASSMDNLAKRYLGISLNKDFNLRTSFWNTPPGQHTLAQLIYGAGDVVYPPYIAIKQKEELVDRQLVNTVKNEWKIIPILAEAEIRGIPMRTDKWLQLWQVAETERIKSEAGLHKLLLSAEQHELFQDETGKNYKALHPHTKRPINFDSPPQVKFAIKAYCQAIKWPVHIITDIKELLRIKEEVGKEWLQKRRAKGATVTAENVPEYLVPKDKYCVLLETGVPTLRLARIYKQLPPDMVQLLIDYSKYSTRATTFGKDFITKYVLPDGKLHFSFHQAIVSTGRLSAQPNSMNIPRSQDYRGCFVPGKGKKFVIADYSQIEPRLTAQCSLDPVYLETFLNNDDIYLTVAQAMLGYRPDITTDAGKIERQIFKVIVLGMAYRMGIGKLQRTLTLALEDAILAGKAEIPDFFYVKDLHEKFLSTFAKLHDLQNEWSGLAHPQDTTRPKIYDIYRNDEITWITAPCGRKRFFASTALNTYTEGSNAPIQGCSATMIKVAMGMLQDRIDQELTPKGQYMGLINSVHDELVYECDEEIAPEAALMLKECMEAAGRLYVTKVPIKAEFPAGTNGVCDYWKK